MTVLLKICYALAFIVFETAYIVIFGFDTNELFTDFAQFFANYLLILHKFLRNISTGGGHC